MSVLMQDLRLAWRIFVTQPALTAAAVATIALGLGANSAIFSLVDAALLRPPPFHDPGRLVAVFSSYPEAARAAGVPDLIAVTLPDAYEWQRRSRSFSGLALFCPSSMTLTGAGGEPEQIHAIRATGDFSAVLGAPAMLGRGIVPADEVPGKPASIVLSHSFWRRRFGGDPRVVGRKVYLNLNPLTVVGVMPPGFGFPRGAEIVEGMGFAAEPDAWTPLAMPRAEQQAAGHLGFVVARLRPGVGAATAERELRAFVDEQNQTRPAGNRGWSVHVVPIAEQLVRTVKPPLLVLWAAVGLVLLVACANVANLLLARAAARRREIAVRTAIGASRGRLVRQLLTEAGLLAAMGAALGIGLAAVGLRLVAAWVPAQLVGAAGAASFSLDGRALAFTALLCVVTTLLAGLVPALQTSRPDLVASLRQGRGEFAGGGGGGRGGAGGRRGAGWRGGMSGRRTRGVLVAAEVAFALVLLTGCGLLLRSWNRLLAVDPGFRPESGLAFDVELPLGGMADAARGPFFAALTERLMALPGVRTVGAVSRLPLSGEENVNGWVAEGRPSQAESDVLVVDTRLATTEYFAAMGIPLRRGRLLDGGDRVGSLPAVVVDEIFARSQWPGQDPIGKRVRRRLFPDVPAKSPWFTVVGVVGTVRHASLAKEPRMQLYRALAQEPGELMPQKMVYVIRLAGARTDLRPLLAAVRATVRGFDPNQAIGEVRTLEQAVDSSVAERRFQLLVFGCFGVLALLLAAVGIYGVTAYTTGQRRFELALRLALGARRGQVLRLLLTETARVVGAGLVLGLAASLALTRVMSAMLFGVTATDPATFAAVALLLAGIALAAAWLPGRRALRRDPLAALRGE